MKTLVICIAVALTFPRTIRAQENAASRTPTPSDSAAAAAEIPKGYEICENERSHRRVAGLPEAEENEKAISPDGRFAMICPLRDTADANGKYPPNLLVQLKPYAVLAKLNKEGVPSNANLEINATWEDNSIVAIWEYYRWGIVDLTIYEIDNDKVKPVHHVLDEARKIFERDIRNRLLKKYPKEYDSITFLSDEDKTKEAPDFKFDGRKVQIYLAADNKPNLAPGPHWTADLKAVWNLDTGKFEKVDFQPGEITVRKPQD
jgi:hypothetical protein